MKQWTVVKLVLGIIKQRKNFPIVCTYLRKLNKIKTFLPNVMLDPIKQKRLHSFLTETN